MSAVIFSNAGTVAKFNRMGHQAYPVPGVSMLRLGAMQDNGSDWPRLFSYEVGAGFQERWDQEMIVFHNPNALHPLPLSFMPEAGHQWVAEDGSLDSSFPYDFIYMSKTLVVGILPDPPLDAWGM